MPKFQIPKYSKPALAIENYLQLCSYTAVLAGNDTFLTENITEDRKKFITQPKNMIF